MYWNKNCVNMCTKEGEGRRRSFGGVLGFNILCRSCSSHTTLLDCCIPEKKSQRRFAPILSFVNRGLEFSYREQVLCLNPIVLCNFFQQILSIIFNLVSVVLFPFSCIWTNNLYLLLNFCQFLKNHYRILFDRVCKLFIFFIVLLYLTIIEACLVYLYTFFFEAIHLFKVHIFQISYEVELLLKYNKKEQPTFRAL